jgi:hypothetical protein
VEHFEAEGVGGFVQSDGNLELASMYSNISMVLQPCTSPENRDVSLQSVRKPSITA